MSGLIGVIAIALMVLVLVIAGLSLLFVGAVPFARLRARRHQSKQQS